MNRSNLRLILFGAAAALITAFSLLYSNHLSRELLQQEVAKMNLYAKALEFAGDLENSPDNCEVEWVTKNVIMQNEMIPTILVFNNEISSTANLDVPEGLSDISRKRYEMDYLDRLRTGGGPPPLVIPYIGQEMRIYYDESAILKKLRLYPYLMLVVIAVFILIVFGSFYFAKKNEQNKVWVGMAKETAHQLGTPVSSLMAWVELLELNANDNPDEQDLVNELRKDVERLKTVAERFSKIGSTPELTPMPLIPILEQAVTYFRPRLPKRVHLELVNHADPDTVVAVNHALFDWVIENLLKNAIDATGGQGNISIVLHDQGKVVCIDVSDSGKGIPKHQFKEVFKPGFTTKKRGWGLGLSLSKRVIENYHKGRIFVHQSEVGKGSTFRVVLPK
jgi:two-component system, sporulation sensor kinase E